MAESAPASATLQSQENVILEVDDALNDNDSSLGDGLSSYAASLTSSVNQSIVEYGRRFHQFRDSYGTVFPADEKEEDRLDMHHALMLALQDDKLHQAPIGSNPQRVIDLGTGTGIWAIDFADKYPSAEVIGIDLAPTQPINVPPNLRFLLDDIEDDWDYEKNPFDYIHARYLTPSIRDWPRLVQQAHAALKPGGWVEFQEWDSQIYSTDDTVAEGKSALYNFCTENIKRREGAGFDCRAGKNLEKWVRDAGFVNVRVTRYVLPLGPWPKDPKYKVVGAWNWYQVEAALEAIAIGCLGGRTPGKDKPWTKEEITVFCAMARAEMKNPAVHGQYDFYVVYGQKAGA